jgi:hypothetical protein
MGSTSYHASMTGFGGRQRWVRGAILAAGVVLGTALFAFGIDPPIALVLVLVVAGFLPLRSRKRAEFTVDGRSFSAGTPTSAYVVFAGWIALAVAKSGGPPDPPAWLAVAYQIIAGLWAVLAIFCALVAFLIFWRPVMLLLTPEGVAWRRVFGYRLTAWEAPLDPVFTGAQAGWMKSMDVDHRFAMDAIAYYRLHPEHRPAIGTAAEHERLRQALWEWHAAHPAAPTPVEG